MRNLLVHHVKNPVLFLLLFSMALQAGIKSVYIHSHRMADGSLVTHYHPFNKTDDSKPVKSHPHSSFEFILLDNLNLLFPMIWLAFSVLLYFRAFNPLSHFLNFTPNPVHHPIKGRAPPVGYSLLPRA